MTTNCENSSCAAFAKRASTCWPQPPPPASKDWSTATRPALCGGESVALTPTEYRLLGLLLGRTGETVRRRELIQAGWPHGAIVHDNTLDAYLAQLRRKLRGLPEAPAITTAHGVGYS